MEDEPIIYRIQHNANDPVDIALQKTGNEVMDKVKAAFEGRYVITTDGFSDAGDDWKYRIKIRQGNKIGAEVELKWEKTTSGFVTVAVDESSKLGTIITLGIAVPIGLVCAYMGSNHIAPLDFLPGRKIAAGLGGLIGLIPAGILIYIVKLVVFKNEKEANKQLVAEVKKVISREESI